MPHLCLYINVCLFIAFSLLFLGHLLVEESSHFLLVSFDSIDTLLFHVSLVLFSFFFVSRNHFVFPCLFLIHLMEDAISHFVHEFLGSCLSWFHFIFSVKILFIEHFRIFVLSSEIIKSLSIVFFFLSLLVCLIFDEHFLKIVTLLSSLFLLHLFFSIHFTFQPTNIVLFLVHLVFVFSSASSSFLSQLLITSFFVSLYFHSV